MMNKAQGNPDYQLHFIEALRKAVPANLNLADEIGHVLGISPDSSYRRIRGRTEFTLNEAVALCKHFDVPLETLGAIVSSEAVTFRTNKLDNDMESVAHYLQRLYNDLNWLQKY